MSEIVCVRYAYVLVCGCADTRVHACRQAATTVGGDVGPLASAQIRELGFASASHYFVYENGNALRQRRKSVPYG